MNATCERTIPAHWLRPQRVTVLSNERSTGAGNLQLVCSVGSYELDVLMQHDPTCGRLGMIGQVTRTGDGYEPIAALDVHLLNGQDLAFDKTNTDEFGEFDMYADPAHVYGLRLGHDEDAPRVLVWEGSA